MHRLELLPSVVAAAIALFGSPAPKEITPSEQAESVHTWVHDIHFDSDENLRGEFPVIASPTEEEAYEEDAEPEEPQLPEPSTKWQRIVAQDAGKIIDAKREMIDSLVSEYKNEVTPELVAALIITESLGNPRARNVSGARGLMGLTSGVCTDEKIRHKDCDLFNGWFNVWLGMKRIVTLSTRYKFEGDEVILAFGLGPTSAEKFLRENEPSDHWYVRKVHFALAYARAHLSPAV